MASSIPLNPPQVLSERDAQLLLKDDADLVLAVYDYWLAKRLRLVSGIHMCGHAAIAVTCNLNAWAYLS